MKDTAYFKRRKIVEGEIIEILREFELTFGLDDFSNRIAGINNKQPRLKSLAQLDVISEFLIL